jgi:hypothetical protein
VEFAVPMGRLRMCPIEKLSTITLMAVEGKKRTITVRFVKFCLLAND